VRLVGLGKLKKSKSSETQSGDLPACSIGPQPTTLPRAPDISKSNKFCLRPISNLLYNETLTYAEKLLSSGIRRRQSRSNFK
jgi:hypothetical protein